MSINEQCSECFTGMKLIDLCHKAYFSHTVYEIGEYIYTHPGVTCSALFAC